MVVEDDEICGGLSGRWKSIQGGSEAVVGKVMEES
jgi:hypothetical protein